MNGKMIKKKMERKIKGLPKSSPVYCASSIYDKLFNGCLDIIKMAEVHSVLLKVMDNTTTQLH